MAGARPFIVNTMILLFFSVCIFYFAMNFLVLNNPTSPSLNSTYMNNSINLITSNLSTTNTLANDARNRFGTSEPLLIQFAFLIFDAAFYIPKLFLAPIIDMIQLLTSLIFPGLGGSGTLLVTVFGLIGSILAITAIFLLIKYIRIGESER